MGYRAPDAYGALDHNVAKVKFGGVFSGKIALDLLSRLKFRDPETGRLDMKIAWPQVPGFRPDTLDACVNWVQEGFITHPEWRNDPKTRWDGSGNALLRILEQIQELLDWHFGGRAV